jgi:F0F1-type ATP synthase assembly protein I
MPDPIKFPTSHPGTQRAEFRAAMNDELAQSQLAADHVAAALRYRSNLHAVRENSLAEGRSQMQGALLKRGFFAGFVVGAFCTLILSGMAVTNLVQMLVGLFKS